MTTTNRQAENVPEARKRFEESGTIDISFVQPPARKDVGLEPGKRVAIYSKTDDVFDADFELPNGRRFTSEIRVLVVESDADETMPCAFEAKLMPMTLDEAKEKLYQLAEEFDFPSDEVDEWFPIAQQVSDGGDGPRHGLFKAADIDYMGLVVDAATARGLDRDRVTISLAFFWCD